MITLAQALQLQRGHSIWCLPQAGHFYPSRYSIRKVQTYVRKKQVKLWLMGGGSFMVVEGEDNSLCVYDPRRVPQPIGTNTYGRG